MKSSSDNASSDDMAEYLQAYLDETDEELEMLVQSLLKLENNARDEPALNEAFRLMHSLKGSSGMMGFEGIAELAHHLEDRFDQFRVGAAELDRGTMNVMLECVDFFRAFVTKLRAGEPTDQDGSALIKRLGEVESPAAQAETPAVASRPGLFTMGGGYRLRVTFQKNLQLADLKARLILARLTKIGEIIGSDPSIEDIQSFEELPQFVVMVATSSTPEEVMQIAKVDGVESVEMITSAGEAMTPQAEPVREEIAAPEPATEPAIPAAQASGSTNRFSGVQESGSRTALAAGKSCQEPVASAVPLTAQNVSGQPARRDPKRHQVAETVRVDIDRLDRLMNLTGELVVTNARFRQIMSRMSPSLKNARGASRVSDLSESLREGLQKLRQVGGEQRTKDWERILHELDDKLQRLEESSAQWDEGRRQFAQISDAIDQLTRVSKNLQQGVLDTRMMPVGPLFGRFKRVVRDLSQERGKQVNLVIHGEKTELDKRMIDELGDPLLHLIRNSIDHGLESADVRKAAGKSETGSIILEASHSGNNVFVTIRDDGAGINVEKVRSLIVKRGLASADMAAAMSTQQVIDHIWHPGFSTADEVTDISGRGVGMDIVRSRIVELNGSIEVTTEPGIGTTFQLRLPLTLAIVRSLMVRFRRSYFTMPIDDVREIVSIPMDQVYSVHGRQTIDVRGKFVPLTRMDQVFRWHGIDYVYGGEQQWGDHSETVANVVILHSRGKTLGLCVDELLGCSDIVIKSLADNFVGLKGLSGASITGDGTVCLMLDTTAVVEMI